MGRCHDNQELLPNKCWKFSIGWAGKASWITHCIVGWADENRLIQEPPFLSKRLIGFNGNVFIYRTYHIVAWQFYNSSVGWDRSSVCNMKAPLAAAISPYFDLTHPPYPRINVTDGMKSEIERDQHTGEYVPSSFRTVCGFIYVPQIIRNKRCETEPTVYRPYPRRPWESLTICRCHYKGSTFSSVI